MKALFLKMHIMPFSYAAVTCFVLLVLVSVSLLCCSLLPRYRSRQSSFIAQHCSQAFALAQLKDHTAVLILCKCLPSDIHVVGLASSPVCHLWLLLLLLNTASSYARITSQSSYSYLFSKKYMGICLYILRITLGCISSRYKPSVYTSGTIWTYTYVMSGDLR